jgi:ribosome-binding ATPase YchF (GTP1/OBG family)
MRYEYANHDFCGAEANPVDTLQGQFSGYGSTKTTIARVLDKLNLKEPLEHWSDETVEKVVNTFTDEKFPTVIALNKIDHPDSDKVYLDGRWTIL